MSLFRRSDGARDAKSEAESQVPSIEADFCEYRRVGDDLALLIVGFRADDVAPPADVRLHAGAADAVVEVPATAVTLDPGAGLTRFLFVVDREVAAGRDGSLELAIGAEGRVGLPAPVERPAIGATDSDIQDAVASTLTGEELFGVVNMLEKRCAIAERVASDLREAPTDARKLAQAYRESSELRELLDTQEQVHRRSADAVEAAEAARRQLEAEAATTRAELDERLAESARAAALLEEELARRAHAIERLETDLAEGHRAAEAWAVEVEAARQQLAAAVAESDEFQHERDDARASADLLEGQLGESCTAAEAWAVEAERARAQLAEAVARAEVLACEQDEAVARAEALASERDEARVDVLEFGAHLADAQRTAEIGAAEVERARQQLADAVARADALERERDEARASARAVGAELADARRAAETETVEAEDVRAQVADAAARADALERERDDAHASASLLQHEIARSGGLAAEAEGRLERERALYEARIASGVETERKLRRQVEELESRLGGQRASRGGSIRRQRESAAHAFSEAQRVRLREATIEDQRAQVAALERQLEQIKQRSAGTPVSTG